MFVRLTPLVSHPWLSGDEILFCELCQCRIRLSAGHCVAPGRSHGRVSLSAPTVHKCILCKNVQKQHVAKALSRSECVSRACVALAFCSVALCDCLSSVPTCLSTVCCFVPARGPPLPRNALQWTTVLWSRSTCRKELHGSYVLHARKSTWPRRVACFFLSLLVFLRVAVGKMVVSMVSSSSHILLAPKAPGPRPETSPLTSQSLSDAHVTHSAHFSTFIAQGCE